MSTTPQKFCWHLEPEPDHYRPDKKLGLHIFAVKKRALFFLFILMVPKEICSMDVISRTDEISVSFV